MSVRFLFDFFSLVYIVVKQTPVLVFHATLTNNEEISIKCLSQEHNSIIPSMVIEQLTLQSLTWCFNQLS